VSKTFLIFGVALLALMAGALFFAAQAPIKSVPVIAFSLPDLDGESRDFAEWDGRHRVLNFWATWCAPCRKEIPMLKTFQDEQGPEGIQVLGIAVDFPEEVTAYAKEAKFNYPVLVGNEDAMAIAENAGVEFIGMPITMFVGREGELFGKFYGELHREQLDIVAVALAEFDAGDIGLLKLRQTIKNL
jgi:thiol-disulfide isomerase/thioredoxin